MKKSINYLVILFLSLPILVNAQYGFKSTKEIECTEIKSQGSTGTCWSFATSSFLESELIRMGLDKYDISEMFIVREIYKDKARNYILPLADMMKVIDNAAQKGYSIAWDGDVSEKGFSGKQGLAVLPVNPNREDLFETPGKEIQVDQATRQRMFERFSTTDDHLMQVVGTAKDKDGNEYFKIKNSWGEISDYKGFLYMSRPYAEAKTVSIMVHKDAIPVEIMNKLAL